MVKTYIGIGVFSFEAPQNFVTHFRFDGVLVSHHAFCPEGKEVFMVITNTVKFTVSGSPGDK
jgi:hypothetical protein